MKMSLDFQNLINNFKTLHPQIKIFFTISFCYSFLSLYFLSYLQPEALIGVGVSMVVVSLVYIYLTKLYDKDNKNWKFSEPVMLLMLFIMVFHLPAYYLVSSRIAYKKSLNDDKLIELDESLLGWIFPRGQLSIFLDSNDLLGPHTILGKFINNVLQISYFTYYLIPYITMYVVLLTDVTKEYLFRRINKGHKSKTYSKNWADIYFIFSVYNLTCFCVFFTNTIVPAGSPRLYLKSNYKHALTLNGFASFLNGKCKDDRSANSFPSGHVSETLCIALSLFKMNRKTTAKFSLVGSILIALATLFLRYHYFMDLVMGCFYSFLSFMLNYKFGYKYYIINGYDYNPNNLCKNVTDIENKNNFQKNKMHNIIHVKQDKEEMIKDSGEILKKSVGVVEIINCKK